MAHFIIESALKVIDLFAPCRKKSLLLLRLDQIGDYILFRNFIQIIKEDVNFKDHEITLCGNVVWRDLAVELDNIYIDRYIWIDKKKVNESKLYWWFRLVKIHLYKYDLLLNPTYSRTEFEEEVASHFKAKEKTASSGDSTNLDIDKKAKFGHVYTRLIKTRETATFEFYKNLEFFENILEHKLLIKKPQIDREKSSVRKLPDAGKKYILVVPFAGQSFREWDPGNFKQVIKFVLDNYNYDIIISGGSNDRSKVTSIIPYDSNRIHNVTAETSLPELCDLIKNSELLITHDTSAVHIAAALDKNTICISNGNYFGRFVPYPPEISTKIHMVLPDIINLEKNPLILAEKFKSGSGLNINLIRTSTVEKLITSILSVANSKMNFV